MANKALQWAPMEWATTSTLRNCRPSIIKLSETDANSRMFTELWSIPSLKTAARTVYRVNMSVRQPGDQRSQREHITRVPGDDNQGGSFLAVLQNSNPQMLFRQYRIVLFGGNSIKVKQGLLGLTRSYHSRIVIV